MTKAKAIEILNETYDGFLIAEKVCSDAFKDEITDKKIALLTAIDALEDSSVEAEHDNGWISVKDRLPEPKTVVLAHCTNGRMLTVGYFDKDLEFLKSGRVTHWRPLPEPPESAEIMEAIAGSETPDRAERSMR